MARLVRGEAGSGHWVCEISMFLDLVGLQEVVACVHLVLPFVAVITINRSKCTLCV